MDRNFLITPVRPVERPGKTQGPGTAHAWGKGPSRRRGKIFILKELAPASAPCLTCAPCLLTTTAKSGRVTGRRHRVEAVATRAITVRTQKNSEIDRVSQLRTH